MPRPGLKVVITGDKALDRKLRDPRLALPVRRAGRQSAQLVAGEGRRRAPHGVSAGGGLQGGISAREEKVIPGTMLPRGWTILGGKPYAAAVEFGRKAGKMPPWGPGTALRRWARLVLRDEGAAFLVARKIGRHGTTPQPFLEPALRVKRGAIRRLFNKALTAMEKQWDR